MRKSVMRMEGDLFPFPPDRRGWHKLLAVVVLAVAAALAVSLAVSHVRPQLYGAPGARINGALHLTFGRFGAFIVPLTLTLAAISLFLGESWRRFLRRAVATFVCALALSTMISLSINGNDVYPRNDRFALENAGILAEFIVHDEGLGLPRLVGRQWGWSLCAALLALAALTATDFWPLRLLARGARRLFFRPGAGRGAARTEAPLPATPAAGADPAGAPPVAAENPISAFRRVATGIFRLSRGLFRKRPIVTSLFDNPDDGEMNAPPDAPDRTTDGVDRDAEFATAASGSHPAIEIEYPGGARPDDDEDALADDDGLAGDADDLGGDFEPAPTLQLEREAPGPGAERPIPYQQEMDLFDAYELPPLSLLAPAPTDIPKTSREELTRLANLLEQKLLDFRIEAQVTKITQGPVITRFEIKPAAGVKVSRIAALEKDLAMAMAAVAIRILAPIPGRDAVGIEAPNPDPSPVYLKEIMEVDEFQRSKKDLPVCLGKTISGQPTVVDLASMPHLLIAGTTGSGKSVCLNGVICSFLMRFAPHELKMIMIDPKRVELNVYQHIPHLLAPVVSDPRKAAGALNWMVEQMEDRYKLLAEFNVRNIKGYNALFDPKAPSRKIIGRQLEPMPRIVVIIDELADLMLIAKNEVEESIIRLAQMARAVGIHLILATQRPSVNVITGIIKANFPARIAFQVSSVVDSRTILDQKGAESLLGRGDMLYLPASSPRPERLQGCFVSDKEVEQLTDFIRAQETACYVKDDFEDPKEKAREKRGAASSVASRDGNDWEVMGQMRNDQGEPMDTEEIWSEYLEDDLFRAAARLILQNRKASVSLIQRRLKIGFARSGRLMDMMEEAGIVGEYQGSKPREIVVDPIQYLGLIDEFENSEGIL